MKARFLLALVWLAVLAPLARAPEEADPAEVSLGERLSTTGDPLAGPFAGQAINCRSCHLVDEQLVIDPLGLPDFSEGGMRTYADFARRSPLPFRKEDGHTHMARNSPALVNASVKRKGGSMFHFDGEFASLRVLVPELTDLGAWNILFNTDFPKAQGPLKKAIVRAVGTKLKKGAQLDAAIGRFKTPGLRDLGHSNPYMHDGSRDQLEDVVDFYRQSSAQQRGGNLRNGDPAFAGIDLSPADVAPLAAFLRSLNEDYE